MSQSVLCLIPPGSVLEWPFGCTDLWHPKVLMRSGWWSLKDSLSVAQWSFWMLLRFFILWKFDSWVSLSSYYWGSLSSWYSCHSSNLGSFWYLFPEILFSWISFLFSFFFFFDSHTHRFIHLMVSCAPLGLVLFFSPSVLFFPILLIQSFS